MIEFKWIFTGLFVSRLIQSFRSSSINYNDSVI